MKSKFRRSAFLCASRSLFSAETITKAEAAAARSEMATFKDDRMELSNVELVALAGCVKEAKLKEAKGAIAEGSSANVDFLVRITGGVQKGVGLAAAPYSTPATVSLACLSMYCAALRGLGIGPARLRRALTELDPRFVAVDAELAKVFDEVALEKAAKLPPITGMTSGKCGSVQSQVNAAKI